MDAAMSLASAIIDRACAGQRPRPVIRSFFDRPSCTATHVVHDPRTLQGAIIDSVLDFDAASGRSATTAADAVLSYVQAQGLKVAWLLETHVHADHLSAAPYLREHLGARLAIGAEIVSVQQIFGTLFHAEPAFARDGSQFDRLLQDGDTLAIGDLEMAVLHVPGHTPADMAFVIGDAVFCGDTLFMPDYGTARADFPGGDARSLYRSIRRLFHLPGQARLFLCHDYQAPGRDSYVWETTIGAQRTANVHVHDGVSEQDFVAMRTARDAALTMPRLILPAIQINMRGGAFPPAEDNGVHYLKIPLNAL
jgi:glyoxylase-like metal-dependent hydrolase (beta-lactamase superfamily II)